MPPILYIVIPCYNEEEVLPITSGLFLDKLKRMQQEGLCAEESRILFVNDGSKDKTWQLIKALSSENSIYQGISLSRNRGHQNALLAGLYTALPRADITISIDADGQDDIEVMSDFINAYTAGAQVVYGVRSARKTDTFFKRFTAEGFYKVMKALGAEVVFNHADYRLLSKKALEGLFEFDEVNLFLRGLVPLVGYESATCTYERAERIAGESKYPFSKMLALALNGITSLSTKPLKLITGLGFFVSAGSLLAAVWVLLTKLFGYTVTGWASMSISLFLMSGVQLLCLGVIGEYVGKIYSETKARPRFIIAQSTLPPAE